jgi:hypothetical protein
MKRPDVLSGPLELAQVRVSRAPISFVTASRKAYSTRHLASRRDKFMAVCGDFTASGIVPTALARMLLRRGPFSDIFAQWRETMPTTIGIREAATVFPESASEHEHGDEFAAAAGRNGDDSSSTNPGRLGMTRPLTRSQLYDAPNIASERLPSRDPKAFGMLNHCASEDTTGYVHPSQRDQFTPRVKMDPNTGAHLAKPDGSPLHTASLSPDFGASDTEYVVLLDHTQPGGERLLINIDRNAPLDLHHSNLANGEPVKYAGHIDTDRTGKITRINTNTGHYRLPHSYYAGEMIEEDPTLTADERRQQLKQMDEKAGAFNQLINNKFRPFMRSPEPVGEPTTPPLRLNEI